MLKPAEIKKVTFSKAVRGYNISEVEEYMNFLFEKYSELYRRNFELEQQLRATVEQKTELEKNKDSVKGTLVSAQSVATKIVDAANERAEMIVDCAKDGCNTILTDFSDQINAHRDTILTLKKQVGDLKRSLFDTYREHIEEIERLTAITDAYKIRTSEEYLNDAVKKTEELLKERKRKDNPAPRVSVNFQTKEIDKVDEDAVDPDELFTDADTVVFEKVEHTTDTENDGETIEINKVDDGNNE